METKDVAEFNKCQSQLKQLYEKGIKGSLSEFAAYRILYLLYVEITAKNNNGTYGMCTLLKSMTADLLK